VDRTLEQISTPYVVYPLENQDPEELADVLNNLIQETVEQAQRSAPDAKIQTTGAPTTAALLPTREEERIRIIADPKTYSLIVYGNKKNQQWVGELIKELDAYRPQVLLDCTLVEITKDESFKYDLDIISKTYGKSTLLAGSPLSTISGTFSKGQYAEGRSTSGSFKGFYNSDTVQALLDTIENKGYGRIMAKPKILVNDNQEGEIKSENTISVAQKKSTIIPGTGTSSTVTTTDVSFNDYIAGVTLKIKPHISKGDMLRLEITLNRTNFKEKPAIKITDEDKTSEYPSPPDRLSTDVTTVSTVPDGTTIILGGLETIDQTKTHNKVPLLGDLPLVGGLFRGIENAGKQGRLYVFVKANILRPSDQVGGLEDMRRVSGRNRQAFEEYEQRFQKAEDWPGIKPRPMDPVRVLEDDEIEVSEEESLY
jgi:general secretion pathway protein D